MTDELNSPGFQIPEELMGQVSVTTLDRIYNWGRRASVWPMFFGLACCAIEMICTAASRFDLARFGMEIIPSMTDELNSPGFQIPEELMGQVSVTTLDRIYNWGRRASVWPMFFGLACCAIEMICTAASRFDLARFGMEIMRPSPRQVDLMIVSGTVTKKMIPQIVRLYNQMPEPKYVLAMGACASGGGPFKEGYSVVSGVDKFMPVDVYVPGCPPTPQALLHGLIAVQKKIETESLRSVRWYRKGAVEGIPIPILGPDVIDPRNPPHPQSRTAGA